jgi:hypothetical protein
MKMRVLLGLLLLPAPAVAGKSVGWGGWTVDEPVGVVRDLWDWWFGGGDDGGGDEKPPFWWDPTADITQNCLTGRAHLALLDKMIEMAQAEVEEAGCNDLVTIGVGPLDNADPGFSGTRDNVCEAYTALVAGYRAEREEHARYVRERCPVRI